MPPFFGSNGPVNRGYRTAGLHGIGFRVVLAPVPDSGPPPVELPFAFQGVKPVSEPVKSGPDLSKPYIRRRRMLASVHP
jgi:hypothetical protein